MQKIIKIQVSLRKEASTSQETSRRQSQRGQKSIIKGPGSQRTVAVPGTEHRHGRKNQSSSFSVCAMIGTCHFSHDKDECLRWEQSKNVQRDKKQLNAAFADSFAGRKKNFEENQTGPRVPTIDFRNASQNMNKPIVPVCEVRQQGDGAVVQSQPARPACQRVDPPSTFAQPTFPVK